MRKILEIRMYRYWDKQTQKMTTMNQSEERKHKLPIRIKFTFAFSIGIPTLKLIFVFRIVRMKFHRIITELVSDPKFNFIHYSKKLWRKLRGHRIWCTWPAAAALRFPPKQFRTIHCWSDVSLPNTASY